jgi:hypothetical protein
MRRRELLLPAVPVVMGALLTTVAACGEDSTISGAAGGPPSGPGVGLCACPPGSLDEGEAGCVAAGIRQCGDGFAANEQGGCDPVRPVTPCGPGMRATLGSETCAAPRCDDADIPTGASSATYVDGSFLGVSDGSEQAPFTTVQAAIDAAADDGIVVVAPGSYPEPLVVAGKTVHLWGRCAGVVVEPNTPNAAGVLFGPGSDGSSLHQVEVTSAWAAIHLEQAVDITVERVWLHGAQTLRGVQAMTGSQVTVRDALIEEVLAAGVSLSGATAVLEDVHIRDLGPGQVLVGEGVRAQGDGSVGSEVIIRRSIIEGVAGGGVVALGADVEVVDSLIRDVQPDLATQDRGKGIEIRGDVALGKSHVALTVSRTVIEEVHTCGVCARDADVTIDNSWIHQIAQPQAAVAAEPLTVLPGTSTATRPTVRLTHSTFEQGVGRAVAIHDALDSEVRGVVMRNMTDHQQLGGGLSSHAFLGEPSPLSLEGCVIEDVAGTGVHVGGGAKSLSGTIVRRVQPTSDGSWGRGVDIGPDVPTVTPTSATLSCMLVDSVHDIGVLVLGSAVTIDRAEVLDVAPSAPGFGWGICFQLSGEVGTRASGTLFRSRVERSEVANVVLAGADVELFDVVLSGALPSTAAQTFGDGLMASSHQRDGVVEPTSAIVGDSAIVNNSRAGVAVFGATIEVTGSQVQCNAIDLNRDSFAGLEGALIDAGGNQCGCDESLPCKVLAAGLTPPDPL